MAPKITLLLQRQVLHRRLLLTFGTVSAAGIDFSLSTWLLLLLPCQAGRHGVVSFHHIQAHSY
jgi:hypothetical protein